MGMAGNMMSTMAQGAAIGAGSEVGHRAMGAMLGPRQGAQPAPAPEAAPEVCSNQQKAFMQCLEANNGDMGSCQYYFDMLQRCKSN